MTAIPPAQPEDRQSAQSDEDLPPLRLIVNSTPRSGNTWVRSLLGAIYGLKEIPVHFSDQVDWANLPRRCVIQIHWYPVDPFVRLLERHGVRVVVLARHPFDVLISWLNLTYYSHQEGYCPGGGACTECPIVGVHPRSEAFLDWVTKGNGSTLLGYSPAWWDRPGVLQARYEDLVARPEEAVGDLVAQIGEPPRRPIAEVVAAQSIGRLRPSQNIWHFHYWQGQPGLWRHLIPAQEARAMAAAVSEPFRVLGYECDPDEGLDAARADQNWVQLQLDATREHLRLERAKHRTTRKDLVTLQQSMGVPPRPHYEVREPHPELGRPLVVHTPWDRLRVLASVAGFRPSLKQLAGKLRRGPGTYAGPHR